MISGSRAEERAGRTLEWFAIAWAFATFFHFRLGHLRPWELRPLEAALVVAALWLLERPRSRVVLALTCVLQLLDYASVPQLSNHYTLQAFCSAVILLSLATAGLTGRANRWVLDGLRSSIAGVFAVLYLWSGLHKLNSAFFDPSVSCATALLRDLPGHGMLDGRVGIVLASIVVALELVTGILLVVGRARRIVWMLAPFHFVIGLTGYAYYLDFSSLVFAGWLLLLGAPEGRSPGAPAGARAGEAGPGPGKWIGFAARWAPLVGGVLLGVPSWIRRSVGEVPAVLADDRGLWVVFGLGFVVVLAWRSLGSGTEENRGVELAGTRGRSERWFGGARAIILGVMVLLGAAPYLGLRTEATFSMFSNLQTENGWNHLLLPEGLRVSGLQEPVTILESDIPQLAWWVRRSDQVEPTTFTFWRILRSASREGRVRYEINGREATFDGRAGDLAPESPGPLLRRLLVFKPVVLAEPRPCTH